jgi:hypothetical protein
MEEFSVVIMKRFRSNWFKKTDGLNRKKTEGLNRKDRGSKQKRQRA